METAEGCSCLVAKSLTRLEVTAPAHFNMRGNSSMGSEGRGGDLGALCAGSILFNSDRP